MSAISATLDMGGWLDLTQQGLTPCKRHQASLDAPTLSSLGNPSQNVNRAISKQFQNFMDRSSAGFSSVTTCYCWIK